VPKAQKRGSLQNQEAPKEPKLSLKQSDLPKKQQTIFALRQPRKSLLIKHDDFDREWQDGADASRIAKNSRLFFKKLTRKMKHF
jgi:hypothetical protein